MSDRGYQPPIVHIHSQRFPRDPVEVFGTSAGLERMIGALIDAVNTQRGRCEIMVRDGFASEVRVACLDGQRREEDWSRSGSPYLDVDDPLVARIIELTDENARLRQAIAQLQAERGSGRRRDLPMTEGRGSVDGS